MFLLIGEQRFRVFGLAAHLTCICLRKVLHSCQLAMMQLKACAAANCVTLPCCCSFGGQSPERRAAQSMQTFFTFVACKIVESQLQGIGRGARGSKGRGHPAAATALCLLRLSYCSLTLCHLPVRALPR